MAKQYKPPPFGKSSHWGPAAMPASWDQMSRSMDNEQNDMAPCVGGPADGQLLPISEIGREFKFQYVDEVEASLRAAQNGSMHSVMENVKTCVYYIRELMIDGQPLFVYAMKHVDDYQVILTLVRGYSKARSEQERWQKESERQTRRRTKAIIQELSEIGQ